MKITNLLLLISTLFLFSCSNDDEGSWEDSGDISKAILGTWNITEAIADEPVNLDGSFSGPGTDILVESPPCQRDDQFVFTGYMDEKREFYQWRNNLECVTENGERYVTKEESDITIVEDTIDGEKTVYLKMDATGERWEVVSINSGTMTLVIPITDLDGFETMATYHFERE